MRLAIREMLIAFRRTPLMSVLGITTIAFSLFAVGLFGLVIVNLRTAIATVEERVGIRAFIRDGTPPEGIVAAMGDIGAFPEVASVTYVTPEQALDKARRDLSEFSDVFEAGVLPGSIEVGLKPGFRDPETVRSVASRIQSYDFVEEARFGEEWVEKVYRVRTISSVIGIALGVAFAVVAIIIIGATIRMAVLARGREIAIMRLVGATDGFIRRPFILEGLVKGILGGLVALLFTWLARSVIETFVATAFLDPPMIAIGVLGGALIGVLGSGLSVGRHLRKV